MPLTPAINTKVKIKPVLPQLVHSGAYEGPCRVGEKENLTPQADRQRNQQQYDDFTSRLNKGLGEGIEILPPATVQWSDDFVVPDAQLRKLAPDAYEADIILVGDAGLPQYPAVRIAQQFGKPVAMVWQLASVDVAAYLRARGLDGYAFMDYEALAAFLRLFRVKKALRCTRLLIALQGDLLPMGVVSSIYDLEGLRERYGIEHKLITATELLQAMRDLSPEQQESAEQMTQQLITQAQQSDMTAQQLLPSTKFYLAARQTLAKYQCNAFTLPCFEICASQVMEKEQVVFCLAHSLLKDEGIPSACEGDINVLLAMSVLMYLSRQSAHMGNTYVTDVQENLIRVHHDVPGLKMKGFDSPDLPYGIKNFTVGGWGGTLRYDISRDEGEVVTIARFNPQGSALLATSGQVVGCHGYMEVGCSLAYELRVPDARQLFELQQDFGHHFALVFGDHIADLKRLGSLVGFEVITV